MARRLTATTAAMDELHRLTAEQLASIIQNGIDVYDKEGNNVGKTPAPAAYIAAAIKFLKDNDITADKGSDRFDDVQNALAGVPDFDDDEASDLSLMN
jgi:hypothetical protein